MKKVLLLVVVMLVVVGVAMAQTWAPGVTGTPITGIDKLGAHQNGGRGCVGCHAPHSGARGNGGSLKWDPTANAGAGGYVSQAVTGDVGGLALWGQDLGPIYNHPFNFAGVSPVTITATSPDRMVTGVAMCLSCHDGNVAKGAMMTNQSFEQAAGLLPPSYGTLPIPTLLGADGGSYGNYQNDHPIGPEANLGSFSALKASTNIYAFNASKNALAKGTSFSGSAVETFYNNYGLPLSIGSRSGAGWVVESTMASVDEAYVVCTTCHTPHSMYTASASGSNLIAGNNSGTYPSFFFIAAPYNPSADTANGTKASSATQFCRQCHFSGAGGSNESQGISIPTAF